MIRQIILAFFGSIFPVILFNIDRKKIWWSGLCGAVGWIINILVFYVTNSSIFASFAGALAVGIYSEVMARVLKTPAFEFTIPGIFPLVPGITAYDTLTKMIENDLTQALSLGFQTIAIGGSIGFGIMLSSAIFRFVYKVRQKK